MVMAAMVMAAMVLDSPMDIPLMDTVDVIIHGDTVATMVVTVVTMVVHTGVDITMAITMDTTMDTGMPVMAGQPLISTVNSITGVDMDTQELRDPVMEIPKVLL